MPGQVLIYGGTGGIGAATARLLRIRGYSLHLVGRDETRLAALAGELGAGFTAGDVTSADLSPVRRRRHQTAVQSLVSFMPSGPST